ncbi:hypothetical protein DOTSEDRAFT_72677 [Dothistroma septosporum NZE10]|uniref:Uncharacterized protein n=1 Tax=Dothistroma septosporum (strain NZE10 / CBS 128990) TaxID=675120 RepID=M2XLL9_DOTSN|nr:hypothetical protein DOTSEDRAFT_72677 [Dothistroma septosporum NZE10]
MPPSMADTLLDDTGAVDCYPGCLGYDLLLDENSDQNALSNDAYWDQLERHVELNEI